MGSPSHAQKDCFLLGLPVELQLEIASWLGPTDTANLTSTCRQLRMLRPTMLSETVWPHIYSFLMPQPSRVASASDARALALCARRNIERLHPRERIPPEPTGEILTDDDAKRYSIHIAARLNQAHTDGIRMSMNIRVDIWLLRTGQVALARELVETSRQKTGELPRVLMDPKWFGCVCHNNIKHITLRQRSGVLVEDMFYTSQMDFTPGEMECLGYLKEVAPAPSQVDVAYVLMQAVQLERLDVVDFVLENFPEPLGNKEKTWQTQPFNSCPTRQAIQQGNVDIALRLIRACEWKRHYKPFHLDVLDDLRDHDKALAIFEAMREHASVGHAGGFSHEQAKDFGFFVARYTLGYTTPPSTPLFYRFLCVGGNYRWQVLA